MPNRHQTRSRPPRFSSPGRTLRTSSPIPPPITAPCAAVAASADGPGNTLPDKVGPVPPPGVQIPADARKELQDGVDQLGKDIDDLKIALEKKQALLELLPDVQIFHNSVRYALAY